MVRIALLALLLASGAFWHASLGWRSVAVGPVPETDPVIPAGAPVRLRLPALGVDAPIVKVGLDAEGRMAVPPGYENTGWFELGPRPGETGDAVIAGHLTTREGKPAVFGRLRELRPGDRIEVEYEGGASLAFEVKELKTYGYRYADLEEVFGENPAPRLNLITCEGEWMRSERSYGERLVVFTEPVFGP